MNDHLTTWQIIEYLRSLPKDQFEEFWYIYTNHKLPTLGNFAASEYLSDFLNKNIHFGIDMMNDFYYNHINDCINATEFTKGVWLKEFKRALDDFIMTSRGIAPEMLQVIEI